MLVHCLNCHQPYPSEATPYACPRCGGLFDFAGPLVFAPEQVERLLPGIWRYRHTFGLPATAPVVSLGEGNTPLLWTEAFGRQVALKCEYQNPSGSFKDRGSATLVSFLRSRGISEVVEDSSGNAGASLAAYVGRAGMKARIFVPDAASGPKRHQIEAYGAQVVRILGPRSNAAQAVRRAAEQGATYASHAYLPFNLPGYATLAYELVEQLGEAPGTVILPAGQGGLLLGAARGFAALRAAGVIAAMPRLVGVQAMACAPLWALFSYGVAGLQWVSEGATLAEGVRVRLPLRGEAVLQAVEASRGSLVAVEEGEILPARDDLARRGFYVEPTSAIAWAALAKLAPVLQDPGPRKMGIQSGPGPQALFSDDGSPVVVVLSGAGLKSLS